MSFRDDDRGASVQVGAILLFAILILAVSIWQAQVVPQQNASVEYTHSQQVQDDMEELRTVLVSAPGQTTVRSVSIDMAPEYPPRSVFVNPGPPSGTLRTVGTTDPDLNVSVANATAVDGEAADFWNGTPRSYNTGGIAYEPGYNVYTSAPDTVYENTVLYNVQDDGTVVNVSGQDVVDGRTITLVVLNGSLSRTTSDAYSVEFEALSTSERSIALTNETNGGHVNVSFASRRGAGWWTAAFEDSGEFVADGGHVVDVTADPLGNGFYNVSVELEGNVTYELRMAKVGVGSGAEDPGTAYAVDVSGDGTTVQQGQTQQLVVEVRDAYNNPLSGVTVRNGSGNLQGDLTRENRTTGSDGRVTFEYTAPNTATTETIQFNVSDDATVRGRELVNFTVTVASSGGGGGSNAAYTTTWQSPPNSSLTGFSCSGDRCTLNFSKSTSVRLAMQTSPTADNAPVDYAVNNSSAGTLSWNEGRTNSNGVNSTVFTAACAGADDVTVYTSSGGSGDTVTIDVIGPVDLSYDDNAIADDFIDSPSPDKSGGLAFSITNNYCNQVTVESITIDPTNPDINGYSDKVGFGDDDPGETEVYIGASGSGTDAYVGYQLTSSEYVEIKKNGLTVDLDNPKNAKLVGGGSASATSRGTNAQVANGETLTFYLYEFYDCTGGGCQNVDVSGEEFTIEVTYTVGGGNKQTTTITFTV